MRSKWIVAVAAITVIGSAGVAVASHVTEVDPATVPTGFLAAHNSIDELPVSALARAVTPDGADVFVSTYGSAPMSRPAGTRIPARRS